LLLFLIVRQASGPDDYFFTSGQREASSGWNACSAGTVASSL
jgi:hypothetical protein